MDSGKNYEVKDLKLAEQGKLNIEFAESHMGALLKIRDRFRKDKPLKGARIGMALHITKETAVLVRTLIAGGALVAITGFNPLSTQDDIAAALAKEGVEVYGYKGENSQDYYRYLNKIIESNPNITIDDGCDLVSEIHKKHAYMIPNIIGGCEETTTGIIRLKAMQRDSALKYPIIAVNYNSNKCFIRWKECCHCRIRQLWKRRCIKGKRSWSKCHCHRSSEFQGIAGSL